MRTIDLAQSLGITVVAKRVSNYDHIELLSWLGLGRAQGFAFGAPVPATVFRGLLTDAGLGVAGQQQPARDNGRRAGLAPAGGQSGFADHALDSPPRVRAAR